jgi:hypothetical protein
MGGIEQVFGMAAAQAVCGINQREGKPGGNCSLSALLGSARGTAVHILVRKRNWNDLE